MNSLKDKTIATLVTEDADAAVQYAGCQAKHGEVVTLYETVRILLLEFQQKLRDKEEEQ